MIALLFALAQHVVYTNASPWGPTHEIRAEVRPAPPRPSAEVLAGLKARQTPEWYGVPLYGPTSASTGWLPWMDDPRAYARLTRPVVGYGRPGWPVAGRTGLPLGGPWPGFRAVPGPITTVRPLSVRK